MKLVMVIVTIKSHTHLHQILKIPKVLLIGDRSDSFLNFLANKENSYRCGIYKIIYDLEMDFKLQALLSL